MCACVCVGMGACVCSYVHEGASMGACIHVYVCENGHMCTYEGIKVIVCVSMCICVRVCTVEEEDEEVPMRGSSYKDKTRQGKSASMGAAIVCNKHGYT